MDGARTEQEEEDITTDFLVRLVTDLPHKNVETARLATRRLRQRCAGVPDTRRLLAAETLCPRCAAPWWYGQYRARLQERPSATKPLRRLLNKQRCGRPLGRLQTRLLQRFLAARDMMVIECKLCDHVTRLPIRSRSNRASQPAVQSAVSDSAPATPVPTSGRRRSKARDRSAGLLIPASLRTPRGTGSPLPPVGDPPETPRVCGEVSPPATGSAVVPGAPVDSTPSVGDAPVQEASAVGERDSIAVEITAREDASETSGGSSEASAEPEPIPLKKANRRVQPPVPSKSSRGKTPRPASSTSSASAAAASSRDRQQRLQKMLAQAKRGAADTGLMAFLADV